MRLPLRVAVARVVFFSVELSVSMSKRILIVDDEADIRVLLAWEDDGARRKLVGVWALRLRKPAPLWPPPRTAACCCWRWG